MNAVSTIKVGDIIRTNYNTGPYQVVDVKGPFTEPSYQDALNMGEDAPKSPPHFSYTCIKPGTKKRGEFFYLNGYDGVTHKNVWREDRIITQEEDQLPLLTILM